MLIKFLARGTGSAGAADASGSSGVPGRHRLGLRGRPDHGQRPLEANVPAQDQGFRPRLDPIVHSADLQTDLDGLAGA